MVLERTVPRLTQDHVAQINAVLATLAAAGAFGQVVLIVEKGRIAALEYTHRHQYTDLRDGSPDALVARRAE